jgi:tripartite-type tricarboxylate transporter receptor subunit TctC
VKITRKAFMQLAGMALVLSVADAPRAQEAWPDKQVRIVVAFAAGGTTDFAARLLSQKFTEQFGRSFFVENKTGASGTIGAQFVAKSPPDGQTFLANDTSYTMLPAVFAKLPWDHANDLIPVTTILHTPVVLAVPASSPFKTLGELIAYARQNPGKLNYGSGGAGSSNHLQQEVFHGEAKVVMTHVPYKGSGEAILALMAGHIDVLITATPTAIPVIRGGKIRALAVTGTQRVAALSDVQTFSEAGLPSYAILNWFGLMAPKGTSAQIVEKMQKAVVLAFTDVALTKRLSELGASPGGIPSTEFAELLRSQTQLWIATGKAAGLQLQ